MGKGSHCLSGSHHLPRMPSCVYVIGMGVELSLSVARGRCPVGIGSKNNTDRATPFAVPR